MDDEDLLLINDELNRKFERLEAKVAACPSAVDLCEALLSGIETAFAVPFVWLTLLRIPEAEALRMRLHTSDLLRDRLSSISPDAFREIVPDGSAPLLVGGDLKPFFRLLPPHHKYLVRSLAVSPLYLGDGLIGSLNHGDASPGRYEPGMDTTRLQQLTRLVSRRLTELAEPVSGLTLV